MASRSLNDLHPDFAPLVRGFLEECKAKKIDVLVTCTWRSNQEQEFLFQQGRTANGKIVTNAHGGQSKHNFMLNGVPASKAIDIVPLENGKPQWDSSDPIWHVVGEIGEGHGLEWAGRWTRFKEYPHFQMADK
jgi:peptidoglycan LD-endopeptidase CwlK